MPQSFTCLHHHIIFSTKNRAPLITPELQPRLLEYIGGIARKHKSKLIAGGGMPDHLHLLVSLSKELAIAEALRLIKSNSSGWIHDSFSDMQGFAWQVGYAAFAVSYSNLESVRRYIANQAKHHRKMTFKEEYVKFLERHEIEYDRRYLWD